MFEIQETTAERDAERWIPCDERLPDDEITVLIAVRDDDEPVWLGWHDEFGWHSADAGPLGDKVTHWRPIPAGPES